MGIGRDFGGFLPPFRPLCQGQPPTLFFRLDFRQGRGYFGQIMFSGLVQATGPVLRATSSQGEMKIDIQRPGNKRFQSLKVGDSVCVNGLCLSVEALSSKTMTFHLGKETLKITKRFLPRDWSKEVVNLETPLRLMDFIGGHFVSAHIQGLARLMKKTSYRHSVIWELRFPSPWVKYLRKKSFVALNGVSLTLNDLKKNRGFVCLIPQTLKSTNLGQTKVGESVLFEVDYLSLLVGGRT